MMYRKIFPIKYVEDKTWGITKMKTLIYKVKIENRFFTLTELEYKALVLKGKKLNVLYKGVK